MTRIEYVHAIKNLLAPIDKTNKFHDEQIAVICDVVYAQLMSRVNDFVLQNIDLYSKEYTDQTVTLDATKNLYYSTLPADIISIPGVTSGLRHISSNQNFDLDYVPITELEYSYMTGSVTQTTDTTIAYWVQGNKVWYDESMTSDIASQGVRMILLPRFREYARTESINIPGATDLEFLQQVINLLAPTAPVDLKANNA